MWQSTVNAAFYFKTPALLCTWTEGDCGHFVRRGFRLFQITNYDILWLTCYKGLECFCLKAGCEILLHGSQLKTESPLPFYRVDRQWQSSQQYARNTAAKRLHMCKRQTRLVVTVWLLDFHNDKETKPTYVFSAPDPHDLIPLRKLTTMLCNTQHNILCMTHQFVFHTTFRFYSGRWHKELDWNSKVMDFLFCYFVGLFVVSDALLFLLLLSLLD